VQGGAARRTLERDRARAVEAIGHIESTGRSALAEMRRLVGVLRSDVEPSERAAAASLPEQGSPAGREPSERSALLPQPGIGQIPALVSECCEAGLDVALEVEGSERPLPSGVELVVYRIVQEALTNTMRHAGPARAEVHLDYGETTITVSITDDGRGAAANGWQHESVPPARDTSATSAVGAGSRPTPGHGLAGMHERVTLYGGQITTGPQPGGGFRVWAQIPLTEATESTETTEATESAEPDRAGPGVATGGTAS
jgi:signal transduction histidine kinase